MSTVCRARQIVSSGQSSESEEGGDHEATRKEWGRAGNNGEENASLQHARSTCGQRGERLSRRHSTKVESGGRVRRAQDDAMLASGQELPNRHPNRGIGQQLNVRARPRRAGGEGLEGRAHEVQGQPKHQQERQAPDTKPQDGGLRAKLRRMTVG